MQNKVIGTPEAITPKWLTAVLLDGRALTSGNVTALEVKAGQATWSTNAKLLVSYSDDARGALPKRLFLKIAKFDFDDEEAFNTSEVTYYSHDYIDVKNAPLVRCYNASYSEKLKRYQILLDDVSDTHISAIEREPTLDYGFALAEGFAVLHARWWGAEKLVLANATMHGAKHIQRFVDISEPGVHHILRRDPNDLEAHWPNTLRELYARHPKAMIERCKDANGFTLIHGDPNPNNILVPRKGGRPLYLIDRQPFNWSLTTWLGVFDLAYALVLYWDPDLRRRYETPILERYHHQLIKHGITDYSWEQLLLDYRLCVAMGVYIAAEYCRFGTDKKWFHEWLLMLKKSLIACDDLKCGELWTHSS